MCRSNLFSYDSTLYIYIYIYQSIYKTTFLYTLYGLAASDRINKLALRKISIAPQSFFLTPLQLIAGEFICYELKYDGTSITVPLTSYFFPQEPRKPILSVMFPQVRIRVRRASNLRIVRERKKNCTLQGAVVQKAGNRFSRNAKRHSLLIQNLFAQQRARFLHGRMMQLSLRVARFTPYQQGGCHRSISKPCSIREHHFFLPHAQKWNRVTPRRRHRVPRHFLYDALAGCKIRNSVARPARIRNRRNSSTVGNTPSGVREGEGVTHHRLSTSRSFPESSQLSARRTPENIVSSRCAPLITPR